MSTDFLSNEPNFQVSADNCEREPIHIPGAIQPHGALIAFELHTGRILHASENLGQWLSLNNLPALGRSLSDLLGEPALDAIRTALAKGAATVVRHSVVDLPARPQAGQAQALEALLHLFHGVAIAEIEPARPGRDWLQDFGDSLDLLRGADDLEDLVDRIALRVRRLIGFDRVMVYRFDADWNGRVIADAHEPEMESFLDLHFPVSDIPAQARELYRSNLVRYIADVAYAPVAVQPRGRARQQAAAGHESGGAAQRLADAHPLHAEHGRRFHPDRLDSGQ